MSRREMTSASAEIPSTTGSPPVGSPLHAPSELEALRREIERWNVLAGGDRGLLEALLHHSPHGIFVCDQTGKFILQNRAAERIWAGSATLDSVEAWGVYRAFHPDGRPYEATDWSMARCLSRREIIEAEEVHFQRFDGTHGILLGSCAPIFRAAGELEGAVAVFADITVLKEVEARLQIITDSLPVLIAYVDGSLRYRFANLGHERWFGRSRAEITGLHAREILGAEVFARLSPRMAQALRGETVQFETSFAPTGGEARTLDVMYIPHFAPDRSVQGFVALTSDITERRRLEAEREDLIQRLSQTVRLNELFVGVVGHDLRNPLSAILNTAQLALRRDDGGRLSKALARIISASERMTRMIEQLLDFTRTRIGGGIPLDPKDTDLGALVRHVVDEVEDAHPDRAIAIELSGAQEGFWDADRLAQAISNLAGNALGHGAPGAKVTAHVDGTQPDTVVFRIWNAGCVRPDILPVLFEPFRGTGTRRDTARGLGLGLYITREIVAAHGGTIQVTSSEADGTTFVMTLPRRLTSPVRR